MTKNEDKPVPMVPVILKRGYQPIEPGSKKIPKGEGAELPLPEAKALIQAGVAERNDPLPGEE